MLKTVKTITLLANILASVTTVTNNVTYDLTTNVYNQNDITIYKEEKQTNYGKVLTWQMTELKQTSQSTPNTLYEYTSYTIYKIDNQNNLPMELERQFIWVNGSSISMSYQTHITQLTTTGITTTKANEYINYTTDQLIANKETIKTNLDNGISHNTTTNSKPLYYINKSLIAYTSETQDIDTTSNNPTNERVIYILARIKATAILETQGVPFLKDSIKNTRLYALNVISTVTIADGSYEVIDIGGLMLQILSMPWSFISTAFNVTLFPGTPYAINIANLAKGIIGICAVLFIVSLFTKGFSAIGSYIDAGRTSKLQKEQLKGMKTNNARNQIKLDQETKKSYNITENGKPFKPKD